MMMNSPHVAEFDNVDHLIEGDDEAAAAGIVTGVEQEFTKGEKRAMEKHRDRSKGMIGRKPVDPIGDVSYRRHPSAVGPQYRVRTLVFATRGIVQRERHFLNDLRDLLPHHKKESKLDEKKCLMTAVIELCDANKCDSTILLENRQRQDLYMWVSAVPRGPSVRFHVLNLHTMGELKMTGNCIKGSRPILHFDKAFELQPHLRVIKALLCRTFGTPRYHAKSRPFVDHIFCFFYFDERIWFRNYQIVEEAVSNKEIERSLLEIGPRFVLNPMRVFQGCMGGRTMWKNSHFVKPSKMRRLKSKTRRQLANRKQRLADIPEESSYFRRVQARSMRSALERMVPRRRDPTDNAFREGVERAPDRYASASASASTSFSRGRGFGGRGGGGRGGRGGGRGRGGGGRTGGRR